VQLRMGWGKKNEKGRKGKKWDKMEASKTRLTRRGSKKVGTQGDQEKKTGVM